MIRENNAQSAIDAAVEFDKRNLGLTFKSGSFLEPLCAAASVDFKVPTNLAEREYIPSAQAISAISAMVPLGCERAPHELVLDRVVVDVADAVRSHIFFAKNTVRPIVKELVDRMEAALKAQPAEATFNPSIVRLGIPAPLESNLFEGLVEEFSTLSYRAINASANLPSVEREQLPAMLTTGNAVVDGDIEAADAGE